MTEARGWKPVQLSPEYAPAAGAFSVATEAAGLVFVSGQVPRDPASGQWEKEKSIEDQARRVFKNVELTLMAAGLGLTDVASVTIYLASISDWSTVNRLYQECFRPPYPARAVVGAALEGFLIEASAIAVRRQDEEVTR